MKLKITVMISITMVIAITNAKEAKEKDLDSKKRLLQPQDPEQKKFPLAVKEQGSSQDKILSEKSSNGTNITRAVVSLQKPIHPPKNQYPIQEPLPTQEPSPSESPVSPKNGLTLDKVSSEKPFPTQEQPHSESPVSSKNELLLDKASSEKPYPVIQRFRPENQDFNEEPFFPVKHDGYYEPFPLEAHFPLDDESPGEQFTTQKPFKPQEEEVSEEPLYLPSRKPFPYQNQFPFEAEIPPQKSLPTKEPSFFEYEYFFEEKVTSIKQSAIPVKDQNSFQEVFTTPPEPFFPEKEDSSEEPSLLEGPATSSKPFLSQTMFPLDGEKPFPMPEPFTAQGQAFPQDQSLFGKVPSQKPFPIHPLFPMKYPPHESFSSQEPLLLEEQGVAQKPADLEGQVSSGVSSSPPTLFPSKDQVQQPFPYQEPLLPETQTVSQKPDVIEGQVSSENPSPFQAPSPHVQEQVGFPDPMNHEGQVSSPKPISQQVPFTQDQQQTLPTEGPFPPGGSFQKPDVPQEQPLITQKPDENQVSVQNPFSPQEPSLSHPPPPDEGKTPDKPVFNLQPVPDRESFSPEAFVPKRDFIFVNV